MENIICIETLALLNLFIPGNAKKEYEKEEEGNVFAFASKTCPMLWYLCACERARSTSIWSSLADAVGIGD